MKRCSKCSEVKALGDFNRSGGTGDGLHSYCRACQGAWYREHAVQHKANVHATSRRRKLEARDYLVTVLADGCVDCGESDIRVLDFDHVRGEKTAAIADMVRRGVGLHTIRLEVDKCEVRCRNCHAIVTVMRRGQSWHFRYIDREGFLLSPRRESNSRHDG